MVAIWRQNEYLPQSNSLFAYSVFRLAGISVRIGPCLLKAIGKYSESHEVCIWSNRKLTRRGSNAVPLNAVDKRGIAMHSLSYR